MIRRPPRSTQSRSSAASDVYKRQSSARALHAPPYTYWHQQTDSFQLKMLIWAVFWHKVHPGAVFFVEGAWRHEHLAGVLCRPCDRGCAAYAPWLSCSMPGALFAHRRCVGGTNLAQTCEVLEKEPRPPTCAAPTGGIMHRPEHCTHPHAHIDTSKLTAFS